MSHRDGTCWWMPLLLTLALVAVACGDSATVTTITSTTTASSTTTAATTTTAAPAGEKTPAATMDEAVDALYAALNAQDDIALRALSTDDARHALYVAQNSPTGQAIGGVGFAVAVADMVIAELGFDSIEVLGDPIVSGEAVAIPVAYLYPGEPTSVGFDLMTVTTVPGGYLFAGGATFLAPPNMVPGNGAEAIIADYITAWNGGEVPDVMALFASDGAMWDGVRYADPEAVYRGDALRTFLAGNLWFQVEATGPAEVSGPYLAVPNRLFTSIDESEGISVFLLRDGKILLHAYAQ